MLHELYEFTLTLHVTDVAFAEHRLQGIILDISFNRHFKAVRLCEPTETRNRPFLKVKFANRGTDALNLKLYCRYLYTRPCMINHTWGLKQLWLQVNGHAWFHLQRLCWPVRNGEGAKNSKWKYVSPAGFEPTPRQSTTGKLQRLRPLGHEGLMVISG